MYDQYTILVGLLVSDTELIDGLNNLLLKESILLSVYIDKELGAIVKLFILLSLKFLQKAEPNYLLYIYSAIIFGLNAIQDVINLTFVLYQVPWNAYTFLVCF